MGKLIRLSKTGIEYGDYAWNFASGCGNNTEGRCNSGGFNCWAYLITQRFADRYSNGFKPTIYPEALLSSLYLKKPSRILCAFMGDLFWDCPEFDPDRPIIVNGHSPATLKRVIYHVIQARPEHTFIFLTKQPQNLQKWSPFPPNAWVGVTATNYKMATEARRYLNEIEASVKYLSVEPLLSPLIDGSGFPFRFERGGSPFDWVIIGAQTKPYKPPKIEWVQEIVEACDRAGVDVFLKENLGPLLGKHITVDDKWALAKDLGYGGLIRQEMPNG